MMTRTLRWNLLVAAAILACEQPAEATDREPQHVECKARCYPEHDGRCVREPKEVCIAPIDQWRSWCPCPTRDDSQRFPGERAYPTL